jgi:hypothetical protein
VSASALYYSPAAGSLSWQHRLRRSLARSTWPWPTSTNGCLNSQNRPRPCAPMNANRAGTRGMRARTRCRAKSDHPGPRQSETASQGGQLLVLPKWTPRSSCSRGCRDGCAARRQVVATHVGSPCATWAGARGRRAGPRRRPGSRRAAKHSDMSRTDGRRAAASGSPR